VEPPERQLGQDRALAGDLGLQDVVEGRDPVGGDHQQQALVRLVQVADLARVEVPHRAMSVREWEPRIRIRSTSAYALRRAVSWSGPVPTTVSTRPPAETSAPSRSAVPACS